ncbi:unnamed protein product, partial [Brassica oleracea var. botrytis]
CSSTQSEISKASRKEIKTIGRHVTPRVQGFNSVPSTWD